MSKARYIVVEGPIGVGKTTLARLLAEEWQARMVLEQVDDNPFLRRFYDEPDKYAFQAQLFFLLTRYRQQQELAQQDLFRQSLVADYLFAKDQLFAQINLDADELALYRQLFHLLGARLPKPDLVVYLQARPDVLMARLRKRVRDYERHITPEYVQRIAEAYKDFFFHYEETPLLVVNCSEIDFVAALGGDGRPDAGDPRDGARRATLHTAWIQIARLRRATMDRDGRHRRASIVGDAPMRAEREHEPDSQSSQTDQRNAPIAEPAPDSPPATRSRRAFAWSRRSPFPRSSRPRPAAGRSSP